MLPARRRLNVREVAQVLKIGRPVAGGRFVAARAAPQVSGLPKCAVVVSKSLAKTAVMRNRLRRAVYRLLQTENLPPAHIVFFVRALPPTDPEAVFSSDIRSILNGILSLQAKRGSGK